MRLVPRGCGVSMSSLAPDREYFNSLLDRAPRRSAASLVDFGQPAVRASAHSSEHEHCTRKGGDMLLALVGPAKLLAGGDAAPTLRSAGCCCLRHFYSTARSFYPRLTPATLYWVHPSTFMQPAASRRDGGSAEAGNQNERFIDIRCQARPGGTRRGADCPNAAFHYPSVAFNQRSIARGAGRRGRDPGGMPGSLRRIAGRPGGARAALLAFALAPARNRCLCRLYAGHHHIDANLTPASL